MAKIEDTYDIWRQSGIEGMRLPYQHFVWREHLGYNLHPSIDLQGRESIEVADVGTGHCLWAIQVAKTVGPRCRITASDINFSQCPPKDLLPSNIELQEWNIWDPVPEDWKGRFDVVHTRLIVQAFSGGKDPHPVLEKFIMMLKPGGYLQWDEYGYALGGSSIQYWPPQPRNPTAPSVQFYREIVDGFRWPLTSFNSMSEQIRSIPEVDSDSVISDQPAISNGVLKAFHQYQMAFWTQMIEIFEKIDPTRAQKLKGIREAVFREELAQGVLFSPMPIIVVRQKNCNR